MALISRQSIEDVRNRADIVALVGDYTQLKKSGASWKGLSPFTTEKTPSFHVQPDKGFFYCFSTNQGGDVFRFLMIKDGLNFQEAVERVAGRFGIELQYETGGLAREEVSLRKQLYSIHETATTLYRDAFNAGNDHGRVVREYWQNRRKFSTEVADEFQIGFAPVNGGNLAGALLKSGYTKDALAKCGLFVGMDYSPDPMRWRARFRGRLMIPIRDVQGRIVAFTARQLDLTPQDDPSHEAKYVNSPETDIFHKSQILFNLDKARRDAGDDAPIVLVEGQLDAIRAYACGMRTAVASQGTAIGEDHMALIRRFTRRIDALLDADRAGQAAMMKILPLAMRAGIDVRALAVPGGKDPDEYFATAGAAGKDAITGSAVSAIEFAVKNLLPPGQKFSVAQKLDALQALYGIVNQAESAVVREESLAEICRLAALDRISVTRDFERYRQTEARRARPQNAPATSGNAGENSSDATPVRQSAPQPITSAEEALFGLMIRHGNIAPLVAQTLQAEWIDATSVAGALLDRLCAELVYGDRESAADIHGLAENDAEENLISKILAEVPASNIPEEKITEQANECLRVMFQKYVKTRLAEIDSAIAAVDPENSENLMKYQRERIILRKTLQTPPSLPC